MVLEKYSKEFNEKFRQDQLDIRQDQFDRRQDRIDLRQDQLDSDQLKTNRIARRTNRGIIALAIIATILSVFSVLSQIFKWLD